MPIKKLGGIKHIEWIILTLAAGILLFALFPTGGTADETQERRLERVLSRIDGAGAVEVFLAYADGQADSVYAFSSQSSQKKEITGVIIVASGAGDPAVKLKLANAAKTALGVEISKVSVFEMEKSK